MRCTLGCSYPGASGTGDFSRFHTDVHTCLVIQLARTPEQHLHPAVSHGSASLIAVQIMYAIRTRSGTVYLKLKRNFGDLSALEVRQGVRDMAQSGKSFGG